jgi:hypothetical protein
LVANYPQKEDKKLRNDEDLNIGTKRRREEDDELADKGTEGELEVHTSAGTSAAARRRKRRRKAAQGVLNATL